MKPELRRGWNRADPLSDTARFAAQVVRIVEGKAASTQPCIFISHSSTDTPRAAEVAEYIQDAGIDVWFDQADDALQVAARNGSPDEITSAIERGLKSSTHLLTIVGADTFDSYWVPFEVGYVYNKRRTYVLTLLGVPETELPGYLRAMDVIRGSHSLDALLANTQGASKLLLERAASGPRGDHQLRHILSWNR